MSVTLYFLVVDAIGTIGFAVAFWFAFSYYVKTRFSSPTGLLCYTLASVGLLWSLSLIMSDIYPEFSMITPWFFLTFLSFLIGLIFIKAA